MWYRLPPSKLIQSSNASTIVSINSPDIVVNMVPSDIAIGSQIDFIQGKSGNSIYGMDITVVNIAGTTITFSADDIPDDLAAGDYIAPAGYSPVVNFVPNECYSYLETLVSHRALTSQSDFEGADRLQSRIDREEKQLKMILEPRIDGEPTIIVNPYSLTRSNIMSQYAWWYGR